MSKGVVATLLAQHDHLEGQFFRVLDIPRFLAQLKLTGEYREGFRVNLKLNPVLYLYSVTVTSRKNIKVWFSSWNDGLPISILDDPTIIAPEVIKIPEVGDQFMVKFHGHDTPTRVEVSGTRYQQIGFRRVSSVPNPRANVFWENLSSFVLQGEFKPVPKPFAVKVRVKEFKTRPLRYRLFVYPKTGYKNPEGQDIILGGQPEMSMRHQFRSLRRAYRGYPVHSSLSQQ